MANDEFDSEMDNYLAERRKESLLSTVLNRKSLNEKKETEEVEKQALPECTAEECESCETPSNDAEKKGFWSSLWNGFTEKDSEPSITEVPIQQEELLQDFKSVAKISLAVMKQLPEQELLQLKASQEFVKFKEILKKHKVIK